MPDFVIQSIDAIVAALVAAGIVAALVKNLFDRLESKTDDLIEMIDEFVLETETTADDAFWAAIKRDFVERVGPEKALEATNVV